MLHKSIIYLVAKKKVYVENFTILFDLVLLLLGRLTEYFRYTQEKLDHWIPRSHVDE